jgi:hypothetical protein
MVGSRFMLPVPSYRKQCNVKGIAFVNNTHAITKAAHRV